jgi:hypothetical protein
MSDMPINRDGLHADARQLDADGPPEQRGVKWDDIPMLAQQSGLVDYIKDNIDDLASEIADNHPLWKFARSARRHVVSNYQKRVDRGDEKRPDDEDGERFDFQG